MVSAHVCFSAVATVLQISLIGEAVREFSEHVAIAYRQLWKTHANYTGLCARRTVDS